MLALALLASACSASIPKGSYGVSSLEIRGATHHDPEAIKACLATYPREHFGFILGGEQAPQCGEPPFDGNRIPINLWVWPWTDWPLYNQTAFERDLDRIERWYQARGYYGARVLKWDLDKDEQKRRIQIAIELKEGEPVLIVRMDLSGVSALEQDLQKKLHAALALHIGEPFDEALYEESKRALLEALQEHAYAKATVTGKVALDPLQKLARIDFTIAAGPRCVFGNVTVEGTGTLPKRPVLAAADIQSGKPFSLSALNDARYAILTLGPFASAEVEQRPHADKAVVDIVLKVVPGRMFRFGVGAGINAGQFFTQEAEQVFGDSTAQWDVHLLGRIEHRNFLGGMRKLRVEDRPRLVFSKAFPDTGEIAPGNLLTAELRQPRFIEPRTTLVARARWDRGPDPYGAKYQRHLVIAGLGPERAFFQGKLLLSSSVNTDVALPDNQDPYPNTHVLYLHHLARIDLRDDPRNTRRGAYFIFGVQHGGYFMPSDWDYFRLTGDARGFLPLPGGFVLAARARIGFMDVTSTDIKVPPPPRADLTPDEAKAANDRITFLQDLARYGPLSHRLRGGGQNSVRGYAPNTLGDVEVVVDSENVTRLLSGGLRQWEASLELRVPISESLGTVLFVDAGDVSRSTSYRFNYPHTSFGLGLRYRTIVGPLRLDAAVAPPGLQVFGNGAANSPGLTPAHLLGIHGLNGALNFTIGEAF